METTVYCFKPLNDDDMLLVNNLASLLNIELNTEKSYIVMWLDSGCVWIIPEISFVYRLILRDYPNQIYKTIKEVKEILISITLGVNHYY